MLHSRPLADFYPLVPGDIEMVASLPTTPQRPTREFPVHIHLLGTVDFEDCLSLQRRLAYDALSRADGRIVVLICEHPPLITIGRSGSRAHVRLTGAELAQRQLADPLYQPRRRGDPARAGAARDLSDRAARLARLDDRRIPAASCKRRWRSC